MELASTEPVRIQTESSGNYILIKEDQYVEMKFDLGSLQRRLLSMSNIIDGEVEDVPTSEDRLSRFKA